ncbi:PREDICTED: uncharacterized protein LOC105366825 [Ceratosolen solmsi marchali]|uniref:Uncharacterized protein LOC105366825 n=1 Tax=Ceratosolen solmsi marchali TaxID=326594 RepID=A0AAJ7E103_9HYME|nr:PREDICTED: uncharacterized protein LOC105366825 [Ceratosolen solmsi marchali]
MKPREALPSLYKRGVSDWTKNKGSGSSESEGKFTISPRKYYHHNNNQLKLKIQNLRHRQVTKDEEALTRETVRNKSKLVVKVASTDAKLAGLTLTLVQSLTFMNPQRAIQRSYSNHHAALMSILLTHPV